MKTFDDIDWDKFSEDSISLNGFHVVERRYWVVRCDQCNHQMTGPVPQTPKAKAMLINQMADKQCKNCIHINHVEKGADE